MQGGSNEPDGSINACLRFSPGQRRVASRWCVAAAIVQPLAALAAGDGRPRSASSIATRWRPTAGADRMPIHYALPATHAIAIRSGEHTPQLGTAERRQGWRRRTRSRTKKSCRPLTAHAIRTVCNCGPTRSRPASSASGPATAPQTISTATKAEDSEQANLRSAAQFAAQAGPQSARPAPTYQGYQSSQAPQAAADRAKGLVPEFLSFTPKTKPKATAVLRHVRQRSPAGTAGLAAALRRPLAPVRAAASFALRHSLSPAKSSGHADGRSCKPSRLRQRCRRGVL